MSFEDIISRAFNDPLNNITQADRTAIRNVLALAEERIWMARGRPIPESNSFGLPVFSDDLSGVDLENAELSVDVVKKVLNYIENRNGTEEEISEKA